MRLTIRTVQDRVAAIKAVAHDYEMAHGMEDELYSDVLRSIADGAPNAARLAEEALKASQLGFARHCA